MPIKIFSLLLMCSLCSIGISRKIHKIVLFLLLWISLAIAGDRVSIYLYNCTQHVVVKKQREWQLYPRGSSIYFTFYTQYNYPELLYMFFSFIFHLFILYNCLIGILECWTVMLIMILCDLIFHLFFVSLCDALQFSFALFFLCFFYFYDYFNNFCCFFPSLSFVSYEMCTRMAYEYDYRYSYFKLIFCCFVFFFLLLDNWQHVYEFICPCITLFHFIFIFI